MFDIEIFDIKLDTDYIGRNFTYAEEVDSTNTALMNKAYKVNGSVYLAERQHKGRGRFDRVWYSTREQNLTFSILLLKKFIPPTPSLVNFVSSLAVASAIENMHQLKIELKWPNDVLINGKKIAGILLESVSDANRITRLVTGIGLNINQVAFQGIFMIPPTSLKQELGHHHEREKILAEILNNFEMYLDQLLTNPDLVIKEWKHKCSMLGYKISIAENDKTIEGVFEDVDKEGFLLLKRNNRIEKIHFGDISLR